MIYQTIFVLGFSFINAAHDESDFILSVESVLPEFTIILTVLSLILCVCDMRTKEEVFIADITVYHSLDVFRIPCLTNVYIIYTKVTVSYRI